LAADQVIFGVKSLEVPTSLSNH